MHYPQSPLLGSQYYSALVSPKQFKEEIAICRTFSLYEEILPFIEKGIIKGGGLENALVIKGDKIMNPEGARFPDEMVRHKVLDLIGDLSLVGIPILGHIISVRSGHFSNIAFANLISNSECS
jgi:UDP-3-O-[3-hydroxymyristoyl] N-acetylglucosamine deacetylase